ncbi:MAG TPA: CSLREA domain-containing protein [Pyrinomonadaceae bacterium]
MLLIVLIFSSSVLANSATFTVTKIVDTNDGTCNTDCSLREAVAAANTAVTDDVIEFDPALFGSAQTIKLDGEELRLFANFGGLTINGTGANLLTIDGDNRSRIFLFFQMPL